MSTRRGFVRAVASTALAATTLGGCSSKRSNGPLRIAFAPASFAGMYHAIAEAFVAHHPGRRVELLPAGTPEELMQRNFRLALVQNLPDVSHDGLYAIRFYMERELAMPVDVAAGSCARLVGSVHGRCYALPFAVSVPVFYYNRSLISDAFPKDWPGILALAGRVGSASRNTQGIFFDYQAGSALAWQTLVYSRGGRMMDDSERRIVFDSAAGLWAAQVLRSLGVAGQIDMSRESARRAFAAGTLAIYANTSSHLRNFLKQQSRFEIGVAPVPTSSAAGRLPAAGNAVLMLAREPSRQEQALEYIRFATGPIGQNIMARHTGYLALNEEALRRPELLGEFLQGNPLYRVPYTQLPLLTAWYAFPGPHSLRIAEQIQEVMRLLIAGAIAPVAAIARMRSETEKLLPRGARH